MNNYISFEIERGEYSYLPDRHLILIWKEYVSYGLDIFYGTTIDTLYSAGEENFNSILVF